MQKQETPPPEGWFLLTPFFRLRTHGKGIRRNSVPPAGLSGLHGLHEKPCAAHYRRYCLDGGMSLCLKMLISLPAAACNRPAPLRRIAARVEIAHASPLSSPLKSPSAHVFAGSFVHVKLHGLLAVLLLLAPQMTLISTACSVPVFRYALEHWPPEPYLVESTPGAADLTTAHASASPLLLWRENPAATGFDRIQLLQPFGDETIALAENLEPDDLASWLSSPFRQQIAEKISSGTSAVWVVLHATGEDPAPVLERIAQRLAYLESVIELPPLDPTNPADKIGPGPPLKVRFETVALARDDPAEQPLIAMLTAIIREHDAGETIVLPVFGRGRVLGLWPINAELERFLDDAAVYICGACSCQVKRLNPGWDLLLDYDWDAALLAAAHQTPPPSASPPTAEPRDHVSRPVAEPIIFQTSSDQTADAPLANPWRPGSIFLGSALLILSLLAIIRFFR